MLRLLALCLFVVLLSGTEGSFRRVCEHQQMTIYCGSKVINIRSASYGRTEQGVCGHNGNTYCHAGISMMVARHECQGQPSCTLHAENSVFGDPCVDTFKYLDVTYHCVTKSQLPHGSVLLRICEQRSRSISCPSWKPKINIITANYGRLTGAHVCGGPVQTTNCGAAGSLGKVRSACQGKRFCRLTATNGNYGDPCYGTLKYLEVRYTCEN